MQDLRAKGQGKWEGPAEVRVHAMKENRRVPIKQLLNRLAVAQYDSHAGYQPMNVTPTQVKIPLKQHVGVPATALVQAGHSVKRGDLIAQIQQGKMGANIHASINGRVQDVSADAITIRA
jgi:biotin carboxyl carrier protein